MRPMRRANQALDAATCEAVLRRGRTGVLAVTGEDGWPYAVPLNYVYAGGTLWLHCATEGHKVEAIRREPRVSFCVVDQDMVLPERFSTAYRSVIVFGTARIVQEDAARRAAIQALTDKYCPDVPREACEAFIAKHEAHTLVLALTPTRITGKEGRWTRHVDATPQA